MFKIIPHEPLAAIEWFRKRSEIDLQPVFQRKSGLWAPRRNALLVDSLIRGYDVPKLYVADFRQFVNPLNEESLPYAVIDGKQRLEALFNFFEGKVYLSDDSAIGDEDPLGVEGMNYRALIQQRPALAEKVEGYVFSVMSVITDDEYRIHDLFVRLNYGQSVNAAERRNAMPGRVPVYIRRLAAHPFFTNRINFKTSRMEEFNVAAKLMFLEHRGSFGDTKASNLDGFVESWTSQTDAAFVGSFERTGAVLDGLASIFATRDSVLSRSGEVPIIYWLLRDGELGPDRFRPALAQFYSRLTKNHRLEPEDQDPLLTNYYTWSRTTNDQRSLKDRYDSLRKILLGAV